MPECSDQLSSECGPFTKQGDFMGLRINTNVASLEAQKNLKAKTSEQREEYAKLSSGKRINKSADDAAGLAISTNLKAQNRGYSQARRNAGDGISMIQVAEGALSETGSILTRMRELAIQSSSDTVGDKEKGYLDKEYQQLLSEVERISQTTEFNGIKLLNGENKQGELDFQVGLHSDENSTIKWNSNEAVATSKSLGIRSTEVGSKKGARNSLASLDDAMDKVSKYRAEMGAMQSRLQTTVNNLDNVIVNQESARSIIEDVDIAESTAKLASINVNANAGMSVLAQANATPASAARLIG